MSQIIQTILQIYFGAKLYDGNKNDRYNGYSIVFTAVSDAVAFISENKWLERIFTIERDSNHVYLSTIMNGYEPVIWLDIKEKEKLESFPFQ